jgi:phosphoribosylformylglycinamidine synthase
MLYRVYVEKKPGLQLEAKAVLKEIREFLGIKDLANLRLLNRYDVENIEQSLFESCIATVFSEPQLDEVYQQLPDADDVFAIEYLPGQFDQRADSAAQCIQLISQQERPLIKTAKVYLLEGKVSEADLAKIKDYLINPVESREASLEQVTTFKAEFQAPQMVETLTGFIAASKDQLGSYINEYGLAMDIDDLLCCQEYFREEKREPTITEIRVFGCLLV